MGSFTACISLKASLFVIFSDSRTYDEESCDLTVK